MFQFYPCSKFHFPLFLGMVMHVDEFKINSLTNISCMEPKTQGAFHLSQQIGQTICITMIISLSIKTFHTDQSNPKIIVCMREMVFQQKLFEKAYFIFKLTGLATAWPASSNEWKAPSVFLLSEVLRYLSGATGRCFFTLSGCNESHF